MACQHDVRVDGSGLYRTRLYPTRSACRCSCSGRCSARRCLGRSGGLVLALLILLRFLLLAVEEATEAFLHLGYCIGC